MREYAFDVKLWAAVRVKAETEAEARKMVDEVFSCATVNAGAWPNGDPVVTEMSSEGDHDLFEIDGEPV